jgi:cation-transporting ATPase F
MSETGDDAPVDWHALHAADAAAQLAVDPAAGLGDDEAAARLVRHGPNRLRAAPERGPWLRFLSQLAQPLVLVLIVSAAVTAVLGEWVDTGVILGVVLANALGGFLQEGKAQAALAALARSVATEVTVLRAGRRHRLDAAALVPGDVVHLSAGDKVPADLRIVAAKELRTLEAALTGESVPVNKDAAAVAADTPLAERAAMAYAGTIVVGGQGRGLVVATAEATEIGRISELVATAPALETPLTRKMAILARRLLVAILALAALTFAVGLARGESAFEMFMAAVALAVGAIPEGLPAAITITLAIGVARMARRHAIVRQLPAVEALGSTTVILSDKTGTLTENAMTVTAAWAGGRRHAVSGHGYAPHGKIEDATSPALRELLLAGVLCNDAGLQHEGGEWRITGDPTEAALLVAAHKAQLDEATLRRVFARLDELPFDAARQMMATLHEVEGERVAYVKGAVERLLPACRAMLGADGRPAPLDAAAVEAEAAAMARRGLRVLALARSAPCPAPVLEAGHLSCDLCLLGLVGMIDPPRAHAAAAVRACHGAGIQVKMVTGDNAETALAIARQLGIAAADGRALSGRELAAHDAAALVRVVRTTHVFARIEPEQKLRIVAALQAEGEIVAMTGDGVNDAPALKRADIGIAMGAGGTEVAKEAAAMVLTDDNFATIEAAVEEGRGIYDNLVKFITWTLPTNFGEGLVILAAIFAGTTLPITPLQILWINMTTAVLLGLTLAFEPVEGNVMRRPPRPPARPILDRALTMRIVLVGLLMLAAAFGLFELALGRGEPAEEARTIAVNVFVMAEVFYLFNCRSLVRPALAVPPFSNPWLWPGVGAMIVLQLAFTYLPFMNRAFGSAPIGARAWVEIVACAGVVLLVVDAEKALRARHAT